MRHTETPAFEQFCLQLAERKAAQGKAGEDERTMTSVAMARRFRARSTSDKFGFFSPWGTQAWLGDDRDDLDAMADMKFLPLLRRAVVANMSAMITGAVAVTAEPATRHPAAGGVAAVAKSVFRMIDGDRRYWSKRLEAQLAEAAQLGYGVALRTRFNPHKAGEQVSETEWGEEMVSQPGEYACGSCVSGGPYDGEVSDDETGVCPECGDECEIVEMPGEPEPMPAPVGERTKNSGDVELTLHTHYEIRCDERDTGGGNLDAARWFEHHYLQSGDEIEQENPGFDPGAAAEWSFPLKWLHALRTGGLAHIQKFDDSCDIHEVRNMCLLPEEYASHVEPAGGGFVLCGANGQPVLDEKGKVAFEIRPGERLVDKFPGGYRFKVCNGRLMPGNPKDPGVKAYDFREEWSYMGFAPDPYSFHHAPLVELLGLGDDCSTMYTIDFQHRERASKTNRVYDWAAFDAESWDYDNVSTKEGFHLELGDAVERHVTDLPAPRMDVALEGLQYLFEIAPQVGSPPPVALGAPDASDDTYGGQRLKNQRQLMLLSPYNTSKAEAKVRVFTQFLKHAQKHWPDERFSYLMSRLGEEWREADVDAFRECGDIERILKIDYAEGSEVPVTLAEREMKMGVLLKEIMEAMPVIADPNVSGRFGTELLAMYRRYAELAGCEVDFMDAEGDERLAQARYDRVREALGTAETPDDIFVEMAHPALQPFPREDHAAHIEFWTDKARALLAERPEPDLAMAGACYEMVKRHERAQVGDNQTDVQNQIESEAPARAVAAEEQAATAEAEQGKMAAEQGAQSEGRAAEAEERELDRAHEAEKQAADHSNKLQVAAVAAQAKREARPVAR
jgi:hypothetical protein